MEIDLVYLKTLIQECHDPSEVLRRSNLPGERESQQQARNTLMRQFERPAIYNSDDHGPQVAALRLLGVDAPDDEDISVLSYKHPASQIGR